MSSSRSTAVPLTISCPALVQRSPSQHIHFNAHKSTRTSEDWKACRRSMTAGIATKTTDHVQVVSECNITHIFMQILICPQRFLFHLGGATWRAHLTPLTVRSRPTHMLEMSTFFSPTTHNNCTSFLTQNLPTSNRTMRIMRWSSFVLAMAVGVLATSIAPGCSSPSSSSSEGHPQSYSLSVNWWAIPMSSK
jgi:hypothetical protein